jgi:lipoate-protein ligase A
MIWRLLIDGNLPGALNMARDAAVLESVAAGRAPATFRFYAWDPPCLSIGKHQRLDAVDLGFCRAEGIDVVRRPTGGRALLHHLELTYSVVAPLGVPPLATALQEAYRAICGALVEACRNLGIDAELTGGEVNLRLPNPTSTVPCFEAPAEGEVVVAGRKLIGSAMRAHSGCVLQHGAILLDWDGRLQAGAMGLADDSSLRPHVTTIAAELGRIATRNEIEAAILRAVADHLAVELAPGRISRAESEIEAALTAAFSIQSTADVALEKRGEPPPPNPV